MLSKLIALFKSLAGSAQTEREVTAPFQEECKFSILGIIKIQLKNPSGKTIALVRLFLLIFAALLIIFLLRINHIELKVTPGEKKAVSQIVHVIAYFPRDLGHHKYIRQKEKSGPSPLRASASRSFARPSFLGPNQI